MKICISGGAGFIGSHLVERCVKDGHEVWVIDDYSTGRVENIINVYGKIKVISKDISQIDFFDDYDVIFHVAAKASIPDSIKDPLFFHNQNVGGIMKVLELARRTGAILIFSSSSSVYGDTETIPTLEESKLNPMSPYALNKLIGEQYMRLYSMLYGVKSVALRYFNVFGERQETANGGYCLVLSKFLEQYKNKEPFTIVGTGEQKRDFVYVEDVVEANMKAVEFADKMGTFEIFNIGGGKNYSINELADMIDKNHPRVNLPPRIEPREMLADITKARAFLGWSPKIKLEEWLKQVSS